MPRTEKLLIALALLLAGAGAAVGLAATSSDDSEPPITGDALERASAAAIAHVGGGVVTDTEVGDEDGAYEVEVTLDGKQIDVHLTDDFTVIGGEVDSDGASVDQDDKD